MKINILTLAYSSEQPSLCLHVHCILQFVQYMYSKIHIVAQYIVYICMIIILQCRTHACVCSVSGPAKVAYC